MASKTPRTAKNSAYVTRTESFAGIIKTDPQTGKKRLHIVSEVWYRHQLNRFKDGANVTIELHSKKPKRSEQQNRYYFGVYLPLIAEETGEHDIDALHELFKGKFLSEGIVEVLGQKVRKKKSTTDLGRAEFSEYIMNIEAETGIAAPPTENYDL